MARSDTPFLPTEMLFISVQRGEETPHFFRLSLQRTTTFLAWTAAVIALLVFLSLFFFRELEKNRKLEDRLLTLETDNQLMQLTQGTHYRSAQPLPERIATSHTPTNQDAKPGIASPTLPASKPLTEPLAPLEPSTTFAKIGFLGVNCSVTSCESAVSLIPSGPGLAQGEILFVLEAEVPRIGASTTSATSQRRYLLFPGSETRESFDANDLSSYSKKPFRFSRGLQTSAKFETGKFLRPLAINIYILDRNAKVVRHERKSIEGVESDAH